MADAVIEIWGMNEIMNIINGLPQALQYKVVQDTYAKILTGTVVKTAKQLAPSSTTENNWKLTGKRGHLNHAPGNLKRSIGITRGNNRSVPTVFAGPRSKSVFGKGSKANDGWYAHMVEYGHWITTKERYAFQSNLKGIPPHPFMRPAWHLKKRLVTNMIEAAFGKVYTSYMKRQTRQMTKSRITKGASGMSAVTAYKTSRGQSWVPSRSRH